MGQKSLGRVKGDKGDSLFIKYNISANDAGATDTWTNGQKYIGMRISSATEKPAQGYIWSKFVGENGANGKNCYIKYNSTPDYAGSTSTWSDGRNYIGFAISDSPTEPTETKDYIWCLFIDKQPVINNLASNSTTSPLAANQGKVLNEEITKLKEKTTDLSKQLNEGIILASSAELANKAIADDEGSNIKNTYAKQKGTYSGMTVGNATNAGYATSAGTAGSATSASKATGDKNGDDITTYAKQNGTYSNMSVGWATNADNAGKATGDKNGADIAATYAKLTGNYSQMTVGKATNADNATNATYATNATNSSATGKTLISEDSNKGASGYCQFSNGLLMQWGTSAQTFVSSAGESFSQEFSSSNYSVSCTLANPYDGYFKEFLVKSKSTTGFTWATNSTNGKGLLVHWVAIGYKRGV